MSKRLSKGNHVFGWIPDLPDHRDVMYSVAAPAVLPPKIDLRADCPIVYDQGSLGSCTAQAIGGAHQFNQIKAKAVTNFIPSRLFIYWNEREMEGTVGEDSGAMIRDGIKSVAQQGVCPDTEWPYDINNFKTKPSDLCYTHALLHQVLSYQRVSVALSQIKTCLASGYPIVFGFTVYESFETPEVARTGMMPMPAGSQLGGHAVMAVGYDDSIGRVIVRNSWGAEWGDAGYFYMPYQYIANSNLCDDFWTIRTVEVDEPTPTPTPEPTPTPDPTPTPQPPKPEPSHWPCDWSLAFPAVRSFVDGAVGHADMAQAISHPVTTDKMIEAGFRGLQQYLHRVQGVRDRRL